MRPLLTNPGRVYAAVTQTIIGSDNVLSPVRHQSSISTINGLLLL